MADSTRVKQPFYIILLLILAGEAVFILPFVLLRIFRPTFLELFELTNFEIGKFQAVYGIVAFFSYLFGGVIADLFQPRKLMAIALFLTALGGIYLSTYPSFSNFKILYGYWGFTTIFLFWAAMIKATRMWGGPTNQGKAFGFLDGGRGLVAALFGTLGIVIFSVLIPVDLDTASFTERREAFSTVILITSGIVMLIACVVWFGLKFRGAPETGPIASFGKTSVKNIGAAIKIPSVWLLMIIILCAYVGYKLTDDFSLYASVVMGYDEIESAQVGTYLLYIRPVVGVAIGFIVDRTRAATWLVVGFILTLIGAIIYASGVIDANMHILFLLSLLITAVGVYAARTLYFAAMREGFIPLAITGTAVGLMSLIGYTPDIFTGLAMGYLLDNSPGELGHQHVFMMLAAFAFVGLIASIIFYRITTRKAPSEEIQ